MTLSKVVINLQRGNLFKMGTQYYSFTHSQILQCSFIVWAPHPLRKTHGEFLKVEVFPLAHHHGEGERIRDEGDVLPRELACKDVSILLLSCSQEAQWIFTIVQNYTKKRPTFHQGRFILSPANRHKDKHLHQET